MGKFLSFGKETGFCFGYDGCMPTLRATRSSMPRCSSLVLGLVRGGFTAGDPCIALFFLAPPCTGPRLTAPPSHSHSHSHSRQVPKEAEGTRECNCQNKRMTRQVSPGRFQMCVGLCAATHSSRAHRGAVGRGRAERVIMLFSCTCTMCSCVGCGGRHARAGNQSLASAGPTLADAPPRVGPHCQLYCLIPCTVARFVCALPIGLLGTLYFAVCVCVFCGADTSSQLYCLIPCTVTMIPCTVAWFLWCRYQQRVCDECPNVKLTMVTCHV